MASSAIKTPAFQAKAGNITNEDGSSIYSNGDWSLKNSTAVASVTITDAGNVGVGTTFATSTRLTVNGGSLPTQDNGGVNALQFAAGVTGRRASSNTVGFIGTYANASSVEISAGQSGAGISMHGAAASPNANTLLMYTGNTERMRIDDGGRVKIKNNYLEVGENTTGSYTGVFVNGIVQTYRATSGSGGGVIVATSDYHGTNTAIFQVRSEGAIYARFTSVLSLSDVRFKEDVKPLTGCLSKIMKLKPSSWKWKDDRKQETTGFIAQEIEEVFPQFVTELEESEQGIEKPKAVGAAGNEMIANLVAAIQEQQAIIEELKAKVSALEAK